MIPIPTTPYSEETEAPLVFNGPIRPITREQGRRLGTMICMARLWRGFSQHELAMRLRTDVETLAELEAGQAGPGLEVLDLARDVADVFGLSLGELIRGEIWPRDRRWLL